MAELEEADSSAAATPTSSDNSMMVSTPATQLFKPPPLPPKPKFSFLNEWGGDTTPTVCELMCYFLVWLSTVRQIVLSDTVGSISFMDLKAQTHCSSCCISR